MAYPDEPGDLIVSLQDRARTPVATEGHLALGVLYGTDLAVFVLPEGAEWDDPLDLEVLISPTAPDSDALVERLRPRHLEVASLESAPQVRVATVRLAHGSVYATRAPALPPTDVVRQALSERDDLVAALTSLGLLPEYLAGLDQEALRAVEAVEAAQRLELQVQRIGRTPGQILNCVFSPRCHPHELPWRP
ncbi:hypothetical protein [Blastococcus deserti]|uniref:Gas vesicle protein GvpL/GvpF n=1 Tax=Blastococcus deserti TaxID=2259033 RepID=A0ABW4XFN5_9ACTN